MGLCCNHVDPTIVQMDFGMASNKLIDNLQMIDMNCADIEL